MLSCVAFLGLPQHDFLFVHLAVLQGDKGDSNIHA